MLQDFESEEGRSEAVDSSLTEIPLNPRQIFQTIIPPLEHAYKMACGDETTKPKESGAYIFRTFAAHVVPRITWLNRHADRVEGQRYAVLAVQRISEWLFEIRRVHGDGEELIPGDDALLCERLDKMKLEIGEVVEDAKLRSRHRQATDSEGFVGDAAGEQSPAEQIHESLTGLRSSECQDVGLEGVAEGTGEGQKE